MAEPEPRLSPLSRKKRRAPTSFPTARGLAASPVYQPDRDEIGKARQHGAQQQREHDPQHLSPALDRALVGVAGPEPASGSDDLPAVGELREEQDVRGENDPRLPAVDIDRTDGSPHGQP